MAEDGRQETAAEPGDLEAILACGDDRAPAVAAPGREPLSHAALREQVEAIAGSIAAADVRRDDKVALVFPNGPEMAVAFLATARAAVAAPLNPDYRRAEFDFYLEDLAARLLIVPADYAGAALDSAHALGIPVMRLEAREDDAAGTLAASGARPPARPAPSPRPQDTALVLYTSGTTSRPKIVPLTHANLAASAVSIARSLGLGTEDRCLNVMPLFHIHGLAAAVLATLASGGTVSCTPGFNALQFFRWLSDQSPTWYTAVPTMHQAVLARAERNREAVQGCRLRLIRSSSSSLAPRVLRELEATVDCPVIEAYGMTEAAHQMTANPVPPAERRPGSVGVESGPRVRIADEQERFLASGEIAEIVISGANVTPSYEGNPEANAASFFDDANGDRWFRTGDQGWMDPDGYLWITGRIKEIINRGGEKVAPREVDDVLIEHEAVAQAVAFAVPHDRLGEEVAAAIVLAEGAEAGADDLRAFARERLADFKIPRRVVFVEEIPKGPTGKLRRIGLAEQLGLVEEGER